MENPEILSTRVNDGIAVVTLGSAKRIFFDQEMSDALFDTLTKLASDDGVRVVVVTGGAPGYFVRHYSVAALVRLGETIRDSGQQWKEDAPYNAGAFDKAMALCETMAKPVIAAISGSCMGGGFEFTLACDLRIAQDGDFQIGLPEVNVGILPGGGGTQRLPRTIGTAAALMHILMGVTLSPREAEKRGLVHETVSGKAVDRAMEIAKRLATHTPESVAYIKRLVRGAVQMPLAEGLALERNLFMRLCIGEPALARMRAYEAQNVTSPSRSLGN
jgi:enoyl-CoA hydratase